MRALVQFLILICPVMFASASTLSDSTSLVKNQPDSVTRKVFTLLFEANQIAAEKPLDAIKNYKLALVTNKVKDEVWEADIRLAMGKLLYEVKNKEAVPQLLKANALYKQKGNLTGRAETLAELAKIYEASGQFTKAKIYYDVLYTIQGKIGESTLAGNTALHLTDVFLGKKNYKEAFKYADMAKNAYYKVCRTDSLGAVYYRIAFIKRKMNSPKLAEFYILNKALGYYRSADDSKGRLKSFDFLGHLYQDQKRYSQAKWFYLQANNQARIMNDTTGTITSLINLGVIKILIGELELAKKDITEAEDLSKHEGYSHIMKNAKVKYSTLFKKLGPQLFASNQKPIVVEVKNDSIAKPTTEDETVLADAEKEESELEIDK